MLIDAYIRVSAVKGRSGDRFISPSLQLERIQRWADLHDATIVKVHEEFDQSGARRDRPLLQSALGRVEAGQTGGIVVARMDRFGRSLLDGLAAIQRIDEAGGVFVSVDNGLDIRTDVGRLVLRLMLSLAEYELDRIRQGWNDSRRRAVARGVYVAPEAPSGYRRTTSGQLTIDPHLAPWVRGVFARRAEGQSYGQISKWLEANGVPTSRGNPIWKASLLVGILKNRAYLGESHVGDICNPTAHPPLVDAATFAQVQRPLDRSVGNHRHKRVLSGLVRCAHCSRLCSTVKAPNSGRLYVCKGTKASGRCPSSAMISALKLEQHVLQEFRRRLNRASGSAAKVTAETERLVEAHGDLAHYRDSARIEAVLGPQRFAEGLARRVQAIETAAIRVSAAERRREAPRIRTADWDAMLEADQHEVLRDALDCVFVVRAWAPPEERVFICWRGEAPLDLPRRGQQTPSQTFDPSTCQGAAAKRKLAPAFHRWPADRIKQDLTAMIGDHGHFPTIEWFRRRPGGIELYTQVRLSGGRAHWAGLIGIPTVKRNGRRYLTDDQIVERLAPYVDSDGAPPHYGKLAAGGDSALWTALMRRGGIDDWTQRINGTRPPRHGSR